MEETIHYLLMADHLMFQKALLAGIRDIGLTAGQPKVLDYLKNHDGAVQRQIAAACHIEPATLTSLLLGMENKELIERKTLNGNRRSLYVYLTDKGKELAKRVESEFGRIEENALCGFTDEEKETLVILLTRMHDNLNMKGAVSYDKS